MQTVHRTTYAGVTVMRVQCARVLALSAAIGMRSAAASAQLTIPIVPIGNPGNAPDPATGSGSVSYNYKIGQTEVTNAQYAAFLNATAASDPNGLYHTEMAGSFGGITRSGGSGSYTYGVVAGRESHPVNWVSFWDACRFSNWLHNGQGSGDTETGAYTLTADGIVNNTITRNAGWQWAVTSDVEWYKAAYHQPASQGGDSDDYWLYTTSSNSVPTTTQANFNNVVGNTTAVGSYAANFASTFDMGGNVWEWNESVRHGSFRDLRGGSYNTLDGNLAAGSRIGLPPTYESSDVGFRVSQVPRSNCLADYNNEGDAGDILDFLDFFDDFSNCDGQAAPCGSYGDADVNGDTIIDILDFLDFLDAFGTGC